MNKAKAVQTTLGDLIVALTDAAAESLADPRDASTAVAVIVNELLSGRSVWLRSRYSVEPDPQL